MWFSRLAALCGAGIALALAAGPAAAQDHYPSRPVKLIVPFAPGGPTDIVGRVVTNSMNQNFGQTIVIENRSGAGGTLGSSLAAKAAPDGYTLLLATSSTHAVAPYLYSKLEYHPVDSFIAIGQVGVTPMALAVNPAVPARTVQEFAAYLKANPGKVSYGSAGVGSVNHIMAALFDKLAGTEGVHIPYAGSGPAVADLMTNVVQYDFDGLPVLTPGIKSGGLRLIATGMGKRAQAWPDVPTVAEAGYPDFDCSTWNIFFAPKGTPRNVVDAVSKSLQKALSDPTVIARLSEIGVEPTPDTTPEKTAAFAKREYERYGPLVKLSGAKIE
jgi:tripartite-type tricarboxylate transporter receptor subunit TctC